MLVSTLLTIVIVAVADDNDVDDDFDDSDSSFDFSSSILSSALLLLPTFMMRLLTAACATDLKSASVGGFDKTGTGAVELVDNFVLALKAAVAFIVVPVDVVLKVVGIVVVLGIVVAVATGIVGILDLTMVSDGEETSKFGFT